MWVLTCIVVGVFVSVITRFGLCVPCVFTVRVTSSACERACYAYTNTHTQKLSSPDRMKKSPSELKRRTEEKQKSAEVNRDKIMHDKLVKSR